MSFLSGPIRDPRFQELRVVESAQFEKAVGVLEKPPEADAQRLELALRWYMKGRREPLGPDAYVSYWIAIEVLFGEWKNVDRKLADKLAILIPGNFSSDKVHARLRIGRSVALRADIVHKGKQVLTADELFHVIIVREILEELLKSTLAIQGRDRFSKIVSDPNEWDRLRKGKA